MNQNEQELPHETAKDKRPEDSIRGILLRLLRLVAAEAARVWSSENGQGRINGDERPGENRLAR